MFEKEIEELNKAIKHLENDILPSKCNGNISCYNEHLQLYRWIKELKSYKEIQAKNNEDIFEDYAEKWWQNEYSPHTYANSKEVWKDGAEFGYNKALRLFAEKRIAELEKENNKLESRNDNLVKMYNEVVERQNSFQQSLYKNIEELEKENAELKERNKELLESCEGATMMYKDLCKAKEIIKELIDFDFLPDVEIKRQAEQFLSDIKEG